ncbi:DNA helicase [Paramicrosporidium saccamoebae]|uniref:DNA replication licensing factor MCM3 n=1 Tax=Paramicrosporidium saccamoebae TaxID=1246581 RepID=A0A2H9TL89_9FUNG|nr:DNA helicase [Paramicrosporidium saccamoebae]
MAAGGYSSTTIIADEQFIERQRLFEDFLASDRHDYKERIRGLLKTQGRRLIININDLRQTNAELATGLLRTPLEWLPPLEVALREVATTLNETSYEMDLGKVQLHVGFEGSFGALHTTPRHLSAALLSHMVCLDGIVTSCSLVRPKLLRSVHYSEPRKAFLMREYWDATMLGGGVTALNYPTGGEDRLVSEFGLCTYRDYQTVSMQEMPEKAPAGQLPRNVDVVLDDDLVDAVKPGDRVQIVGVYKSLAGSSQNASTIPATFRAVLIGLGVKLIGADAQTPTLSTDDMHNIRAMGRRRDVFDLLSRSLAPSIYGHEFVKKAVLLMLLGGVEKNLANGTHLRGDINLMLVGDPSTAKSQMLRFVLALAPLAIATTGRGSSGVGLTAAVTTDKETGERRLEAGAMVLADRGIVCIDEFDKMSDMDRVAIHEVMEQQTVTIAKAGIHASLNARCAVLAAANPIWGQYRETASPQENIRLPDSLLSRFDLLFIILDTSDPEHDHRISSHVLKMHRFIPTGLTEGQPISENTRTTDSDDEEERGVGTAVFQKHYGVGEEDADDEILTIPFLKKYIHHAKSMAAPVLTKAATDCIVTAYSEFRQKRDAEAGHTEAKTFPVTPRTLETLIRLATAHAKARLSARVERKDARMAVEMVQFCLYKEVKKKPSKRRRKQANDDSGTESSDNSDHSDEDTKVEKDEMAAVMEDPASLQGLTLEEVGSTMASASIVEHPTSIPPTQTQTQSQSQNYIDSASLEGTFVEPSQDSLPIATQPTEEVSRAVRAALHRLRSASTSAVFATNISDVHAEIAKEDPPLAASLMADVLMAVVQEMQRLNQVMISDGVIYII